MIEVDQVSLLKRAAENRRRETDLSAAQRIIQQEVRSRCIDLLKDARRVPAINSRFEKSMFFFLGPFMAKTLFKVPVNDLYHTREKHWQFKVDGNPVNIVMSTETEDPDRTRIIIIEVKELAEKLNIVRDRDSIFFPGREGENARWRSPTLEEALEYRDLVNYLKTL